jgi:hypothetical protein
MLTEYASLCMVVLEEFQQDHCRQPGHRGFTINGAIVAVVSTMIQ